MFSMSPGKDAVNSVNAVEIEQFSTMSTVLCEMIRAWCKVKFQYGDLAREQY